MATFPAAPKTNRNDDSAAFSEIGRRVRPEAPILDPFAREQLNPELFTDIQESTMTSELPEDDDGQSGDLGLDHWMRRVLKGCEKAQRKFAPKSIHSLRVAIRRCRSMAEVLSEIDSDPAWADMIKSGKNLMKGLGKLRDIQVMREWVGKLAPKEDPVGLAMLEILSDRERSQKLKAAKSLKRFDARQWSAWTKTLPERARQVPLDGLVFEHVALEGYNEAYALHIRAIRNRTRTDYHQLRVGIKRFRYIVENFLPRRHAEWGSQLAAIQDILGEVHDLDVLWEDLSETGAVFNKAARKRWLDWVETARKIRLDLYQQQMAGKSPLWDVWRAGLPEAERLQAAALAKIDAWASFLDPDIFHARHVASLAVQVFDGLGKADVPGPFSDWRLRRILRAAALTHEVGGENGDGPQQEKSYRRIEKLALPIGWTENDREMTALVARYHWKGMPRKSHRGFASLPDADQEAVVFLTGILRLVNALDHHRDGAISLVDVGYSEDAILIRANGFEEGSLEEILSSAKNLLELACDKPVTIRPAG